VLGRCSQLAGAPLVPVTLPRVGELTPAGLGRIADAAEQLRRSWRPVAQRHTFLWRDVVDRDPVVGRVQMASEALGALKTLVEVNHELVASFALVRPDDADSLLALMDHAHRRPPASREDWLTLPGLEPVERAFQDPVRLLSSLHDAERLAREQAGVAWHLIPDLAGLPVIPSPGRLDPSPLDFGTLTAHQAVAAAHQFDANANRLERQLSNLDRVADTLGLPRAATFTDAARLAAAVEFARRPHRPEQFWFAKDALQTACAAAEQLRSRVDQLISAEREARRFLPRTRSPNRSTSWRIDSGRCTAACARCLGRTGRTSVPSAHWPGRT
jgi:hypothetical protein